MPTRESDDLYSLLAENIRDYAIFIADREGYISKWGLGAARLFGYEDDEAVGNHIAMIFTPEDRERREPERELQTAREFGHAEDERWHLRKDGSLFWASGILTALRDDKGELVGFAKVARDATRRKLAEAGLEREKRISDALIASLPSIFYLISAEGRFMRWNQNFEQVSGYSAEEIGRMHPLDFFAGEDKQLIAERIGEVFARGRSTAEACFVSKDGRETPYFFTGQRVNVDGQDCLIGVGIDISERRWAEREREKLLAREQTARAVAEMRLRESQRLAQVTQELTASLKFGDVVSILCRGARALVGADGAAFIQREGNDVYYAEEDAERPLWKGKSYPVNACVSGWAILEHTPVTIEDIAADTRSPAELSAPTFVRSVVMIPIHAQEPVGALGVYWAQPHRADEHELALLQALANQAEIALANAQLYEQAQEARVAAEAANRAKDEFISTVSHDLRSPLNAILGWAKVLSGSRPLDEAARQQAAGVIERNVKVQARLINDLLDVAKMKSGNLYLDLQDVDIALAVVGAIESVHPAADAKGVRLGLAVDYKTGIVRGDPHRLQQVVLNLLSNAVKFTPAGGEVEVQLARREGQAEIIVKDNGSGIRPHFLPRIFDRYASDPTSISQGGLGLGLAIVKHLVESHGGSVTAESGGEGAGATFTVRLPLSSGV